MSITFKLGNSRRYLGLVTLEIAAADEVDKRGVEDQLLYIKNIWRCAWGNAQNLYRGDNTYDLPSCREA